MALVDGLLGTDPSHGFDGLARPGRTQPEAKASLSQQDGLAWLDEPWLGWPGFWLEARASTTLDASSYANFTTFFLHWGQPAMHVNPACDKHMWATGGLHQGQR
jgi:hypothetical protein